MALKFPTVTTLVFVCFCALGKNRGEFAAGHKLAVLMGVELQTQLSGAFEIRQLQRHESGAARRPSPKGRTLSPS
jgi:hypothetical protein